jgi:ribonuclease D
MERLEQDKVIKQACLKACADGFTVKKYLDKRAKASIEEPEKTYERKGRDEIFIGEIAHPELYTLLKRWRMAKGAELNEPIHRVLSQKSMAKLANNLPTTLVQLFSVKGVGHKKLEKFGEEILDIVVAYCNEKKLPISAPELHHSKKTSKIIVDSKRVSYELFEAGKSVEDIAKERQMAISTIEGHLAWFISSGELNIKKLVPAEKIEMISNVINEFDASGMGQVKAALGEKVSWSELRFVMNHLKYKQKSEAT